MMRIPVLIGHIGIWLTLLGPIFLAIGFIGESQAVAIHVEREDAQLERKVNLSFSLKQLEGEVVITVSTKPAPQMVGMGEKDTSGGTVPELRLDGDEEWKEKWTSQPLKVKEAGTKFPEKFPMKFKFSELQPMKFDVKYAKTGKLAGSLVTYLSDIASVRQKVEFLEKADDFGDGVIIVEFEEDLKGFNDEVAFEFVGENFQAPESKYPYMILSRQKPDKTWTEIDYTFTKDFGDRKNPAFRPLSVRVSHISEAKNNELQLKFVCYLRDYDDPDLKETYLGEFHTTYQELVEGATHNCNPLNIYNDDINIVTLKARSTVPTFLKIVPGLDIQVYVAIDFTTSNRQGKYEHAEMGMHTVGTTMQDDFNYYEQALSSIVPVVEHFDNDRMMPLSGFGGRKKGERKMNPFFFLKPLLREQQAKNDKSEFCHGSIDLLRTYHNLMLEGAIALSSPTNYTPTLKHIADQACKKRGHNDTFYMLVMLTDGEYSDPEKAKLEIAKASDCPLSIVLVGIGEESFKQLEELDNDDGSPFREKDDKGVIHEAKADIVQLVVFRDFYDKMNLSQAMKGLKDKVLEEFPIHIQNYFKMHNLEQNEHAIKRLEDVDIPAARTKVELFDLQIK